MIYDSNNRLAKEIKKLLMDLDVSQREIAARMGISPQGFQNLLNKKQFCFVDLQRILDCLDYDLIIEFKKRGTTNE